MGNFIIGIYIFVAFLFLIYALVCEEENTKDYKRITYKILRKLQRCPYGGLIFYFIVILAGFLMVLIITTLFKF